MLELCIVARICIHKHVHCVHVCSIHAHVCAHAFILCTYVHTRTRVSSMDACTACCVHTYVSVAARSARGTYSMHMHVHWVHIYVHMRVHMHLHCAGMCTLVHESELYGCMHSVLRAYVCVCAHGARGTYSCMCTFAHACAPCTHVLHTCTRVCI